MPDKKPDHEVTFGDLNDEAKKFLEDLRPEEVELLKASINFMRSAVQMSRVIKWLGITAVGAFVMGGQIAEGLSKFKAWIVGAAK